MFESHFGLRENPFASGHQSRFVYPSREHQEALAHLRYGIGNLEPFVLITGEVGTGKTTALFEAVVELQTRVSVALITNSALTRGELLEEICLRFGVPVAHPVSKPQAMAQLEQHLLALRGRGERAILLIDEAQNFDRELLEEIRLFSNLEANGETLLQIILVGQPELESKLSTPELRQLRQRIPVHYRLRPLTPEETEAYIWHRISVAGGHAQSVFPAETCAEVHAVTNGIPREINQICSQAMLDAYVEGLPGVTPQHVRAAAQETRFQSVIPMREDEIQVPQQPSWPAALPARSAPAEPPVAAPLPAPAPPPAAAAPAPAEAPQEQVAPEPPAPAPLQPAPEPSPVVEPEPVAAPAEPALEAIEKIEVPRTPPTPPQAAPGTHFAAESALKPPHVPSRLYERLRDEEPEKSAHIGIRLLIGLAVLAVVVIGAILMFRFGPWAKPKPPVQPLPVAQDTLPAFPAQDTSDTMAGAGTMAEDTTAAASLIGETAIPRAPEEGEIAEPTPAAPTPKPAAPKAETPAPGTEATKPAVTPTSSPEARAPKPATIAAPRPAAAPGTEYGLSVGTYLDRARADSELARIAGVTGLPGRITTVQRDNAIMYAVVIGAFTDRDAAERKAGELVKSGSIDEAQVIPRAARKP